MMPAHRNQWPGISSVNTPKPTPKTNESSTVALASRLWQDYLSRYWPRLALSLAAMAIYAGSMALIPVGVEWINAGFSGGSDRFSPSIGAVVTWGPIFVIVLGAVTAIAQYLQTRLSAGAALSTLCDIQNDMFDKLMALDLAQQRSEVSAQTTSRFTNDTMVLRETLMRAAVSISAILTLGALVGRLIWYDWVLTLVVVSIYPLIGIPVSKIGRMLRDTSSKTQRQAGDIMALVGETLTGARMVKSYQIEPLERARAGDAFNERLGLLKKLAFTRALNEPLILIAGSAAFGIVTAAAAWRISSGALDGPAFTAFIVTLLLVSQPARALGTINAVMQEGFGAFERILSLIDLRPIIRTADDAVDLVAGPGAIRFDGVGFAYQGDVKALDGVTLDIAAGSMVALVGESGAGKSTLMNLLPRLYEPEAGQILIDGEDISRVTLRSLRARIAMVSQDAIIFNMSALENIAFGRPGASRAEIIKAATDAAANEFIGNLQNGYDTPLGEGGANLSGGQRQRIALARAFLKDAPILLMDEATSALDAESETKIQEALKRLTAGRTTIVIAHRLSTVKDADLIAVMGDGRIIETGSHDELLAKGGAYARQAALQLA